MTWWQRFRNQRQLEIELDSELRFHFDRVVADTSAPERDLARNSATRPSVKHDRN